MYYALGLFVLTYVLMLALPKWRPFVALGSALIFIVSGMLPLGDVLPSVDFNVLLMIAGTMGTVALMIESKMPNLLADIIIEKVPNVKWANVILSLFAGIVSAFIDNVATVLMLAPVGLALAKKLNMSVRQTGRVLQQTYGKGYFQTTIRLNDGSAVGLSVGKYTTPKGATLAGVGITPDVVVEVDEDTDFRIFAGIMPAEEDPQIQAAIKALTGK